METEKQVTNSNEETQRLGFEFAKRLIPCDIVAIYGGVGAGKTEFIKGVCLYFNVRNFCNCLFCYWWNYCYRL